MKRALEDVIVERLRIQRMIADVLVAHGFVERQCRRPSGRSWAEARGRSLRAAGGICQRCKDAPAVDVHHVIPWCMGGRNAQWNLVPVCETCHGFERPFSPTSARWIVSWAETGQLARRRPRTVQSDRQTEARLAGKVEAMVSRDIAKLRLVATAWSA